MSIVVNFADGGGMSHVVAAGKPGISALLPVAASYGGIAFTGTLFLSRSMRELAVRGIVVDAAGARPFVLTPESKPVEAVERTTRASLAFCGNRSSLILSGSELQGSAWADAEDEEVLTW